MKKLFQCAAVLLALSTLNSPLSTANAQGTAFTYNGRLNVSGAPANGNFDLQFTLYNAATNGSVFGALTNAATGVSNGLFAVSLDFGGVFNGSNYWLELAARTNGGGAFSTLSPRQAILPTPYAMYSANAAQLAGHISSVGTINSGGNPVDWSQLKNVPAGAANGYTAGTGVSLSGTTIANAGVLAVNGNADITASTTGGTVTLGDTATSANTASTLVKRDASGNFSAGAITANSLNGSFIGNGAGVTNLNGYVAKAGDTMTGTLNLPANGLVAGGSQMVLTNGNVGIGATSPSRKLDIAGDARLGVASGNTALEINNTSVSKNWQVYPVSNGSNTDLRLFEGGANDRVTFQAGGNVGVGTTTPTAPLHVSSANSIAAIFDRTGGAGATIKLNNGASNYGLISYLFGANSLELGPYGQTSILHLDSNGNVGIGTTTPNAGLHIQNSGGHLALFQTTQTGAGIRDLGFANSAGSVRVGIGYDPSLDALQIYDTAGINSTFKNGNVGIGMIPSDKLDVNGSVSIFGVNGQASLYVTTDNAGRGIRLNTPDFNGTTGSMLSIGMGAGSGATMTQLQAYNGGSYGNISINGGGGNVGIGTTTPATMLAVNGDVSIGPDLKFDMNLGHGGWTDWIKNFFGPAVYYSWYTGTAYPFLSAGNLILQPRTDYLGDIILAAGYPTPTARLVVQNGGNIGIGTTSPGSKLSVNGSARLIGTSTSSVGLAFGTDDGVSGWTIGNGIIDATHNFRIYDNSAGQARVTVDPSGNVGIGTASPTSKLYVNQGNIFIAPNANTFLSAGDGITSADLSLQTAGVRLFSNLGLLLAAGGTERVRIDPSGNVGIGTTNPAAALDVNGSIHASGTISAIGGLVIENRTSDPATPATGQIWLRTDLP